MINYLHFIGIRVLCVILLIIHQSPNPPNNQPIFHYQVPIKNDKQDTHNKELAPSNHYPSLNALLIYHTNLQLSICDTKQHITDQLQLEKNDQCNHNKAQP